MVTCLQDIWLLKTFGTTFGTKTFKQILTGKENLLIMNNNITENK